MYVRKNAFFNFPYFFQEFPTIIDYKKILMEVFTNPKEDPEILRILAASLNHLFKAGDKLEPEEKTILRDLFEMFLLSSDKAIKHSLAEHMNELMPFFTTFLPPPTEEDPDQSPGSLSTGDTFASHLNGVDKGKIGRKASGEISEKS